MRIATLVVLLFLSSALSAQDNSGNITFKASFGQQPLVFGKPLGADSIIFQNIRFYISDLQFSNNNLPVAIGTEKAYLIDLKDSNSCKLKLNIAHNQAFNQLSFLLGIDSSTSTAGAIGGALDPTNGMYWTWQSGYINIKIEGQSYKCPARKNKFQFHLGGYACPHNAAQKCTIALGQSADIVLNIDLAAFFKNIDLEKNYEIMSPSQSAVLLSKSFAQLFNQAP